MRHPKIPREVRLPFGFVVPVKWTYLSGADGQFTSTKDTRNDGPKIEIDSRQSSIEQIRTFAHEMLHAAADYDRWVNNEIVAPLRDEAERTRRALLDKEEKHED